MRSLNRLGNRRASFLVVAMAAFAVSHSQLHAQFAEFVNETDSRINAPSSLVVDDPEEKDYAWGDLDQDGDTDLVIVRKQPFSTIGKRVNVLLINEGGVLVDRTDEFATASDILGDNGFSTPTNDLLVDRHLKLVLFPSLLGDDPQLPNERAGEAGGTPDGVKTAWLECSLMLE